METLPLKKTSHHGRSLRCIFFIKASSIFIMETLNYILKKRFKKTKFDKGKLQPSKLFLNSKGFRKDLSSSEKFNRFHHHMSTKDLNIPPYHGITWKVFTTWKPFKNSFRHRRPFGLLCFIFPTVKKNLVMIFYSILQIIS